MPGQPPLQTERLDEAHLARLREMVDKARAELRERHGKINGLETAAMYSDALSRVLKYHMSESAERLGCSALADGIVLIAVGGFGRFELGLHSDVDFCFITEHTPTAEEEEFIKAVLYPLWGLKVDLGYCVHSVREALDALGKDLHKTTAFLETRPIWGNEGIWEELNERIHAKLRKSHLLWFLQSLEAETRERHAQFGDTVQLLEPDVKNSAGGLRDIHLVLWIAFAMLGVSELNILSENGVISESERVRLHQAWSFLIEVRNSLHIIENRRIDKMTLERQIKVAPMMGMQAEDILLAEQQLMRTYYDHASIVERISWRVMGRALRSAPGTESHQAESLPSRRVDRDFWVRGNRIWVESRDLPIIDEDRLWPLRLFLAAARQGLFISDNTLRHVEERNASIDDAYRESLEARMLFLELLKTPGNLAHTLRAMNRCRFLSAFIPEFASVHNLPRIDHYHQFTVDEHLIRSVGMADKLLSEDPPKGMEHVAQTAKEILRLDLLNLALLVHDLGKGEGRAHVIQGMHLAQRISERMHLRPVEADMVRRLVANHQKMTHLIARRDLEDLSPAREVAEALVTPEMLRMLYVHSVCDLAAVSAESWNDWRGRLLQMLYRQALSVLHGEDQKSEHRAPDPEIRGAIWEDIQKEAGGRAIDRVVFERFIGDMPERYLRSVTTIDAARHFLLSLGVTRERRLAHRVDIYEGSSYVEVAFVANDAPGLFSLLCGALASKSINILSAQIYTAFSGEAVDIFQLQVPPAIRGTLDIEMETLCARLSDILKTGKKPTWEKTLKARGTAPITREHLARRPPRVDIANDTSPTHTVIEVRAPDRPGLLSEITGVFDRHNINIDLAFITTESYHVVDVFYVTDLETNKIQEEKALERLKSDLMETIHSGLQVQ